MSKTKRFKRLQDIYEARLERARTNLAQARARQREREERVVMAREKRVRAETDRDRALTQPIREDDWSTRESWLARTGAELTIALQIAANGQKEVIAAEALERAARMKVEQIEKLGERIRDRAAKDEAREQRKLEDDHAARAQ